METLIDTVFCCRSGITPTCIAFIIVLWPCPLFCCCPRWTRRQGIQETPPNWTAPLSAAACDKIFPLLGDWGFYIPTCTCSQPRRTVKKLCSPRSLLQWGLWPETSCPLQSFFPTVEKNFTTPPTPKSRLLHIFSLLVNKTDPIQPERPCLLAIIHTRVHVSM